MNKWIRLIDEKPKRRDIYRVVKYDEYLRPKFHCDHLVWDKDDGFQPLDCGDAESYPINMDVTHWLKIDEPPIPRDEAKKLLIKTEVFFDDSRLESFAKQHKIIVYEEYGNAIKYIVSGVPNNILKEMRRLFKSQEIYNNILNKKAKNG